ncbi:MAG: hydantoinase/oxoprolinase family protein [Salinirussus sp.]
MADTGRRHLGIDIGGTFTDITYTVGDGDVRVDKRLTSRNPATTVRTAIKHLEDEGSFSLENCELFSHATTIATNALIEREGAQVGLVTTAGFSDVIEMRDESRYDLYDVHISFPEPIPSRPFRADVPERTTEDGEVLTPLDEDVLIETVGDLRDAGAETIAVCFLHSYIDDTNERTAASVIEEEFPDLDVSVSSDVAPQLGEYPRMTTTSINAYLRPIIEEYIGDLEAFLDEQGFAGTFLIMTSGGGVMPAAAAKMTPVRMLESGPTAGALVSRYLGRQRDEPDILSFDMGGTTSKGCLIEDYDLDRSFTFEAAREHEFKAGSGYPLLIPNVNLIEFSSGGGSIASVDDMGTLTIGPESQGSDPGPASYSLGGQEATITDADVTLGYLREGVMGDASISIDRDLATAAIDDRICAELGVGVREAAAGIYRAANENIANAFKEHAAERGVDIRRSSILAFGGAGPMHATSIARSLNVDTVIVPPNAGVLSSFGLLVTPRGVSVTAEIRRGLEEVRAATLEERFEELRSEAISVLDLDESETRTTETTRKLDVRFTGQGFDEEVVVPTDLRLTPSNIREAFLKHYRQRYDVAPDKSIRVSGLKLELSAPSTVSDVRLADRDQGSSVADARITEQPAYYPDEDAEVTTTFYDRRHLPSDVTLEAPCIVEGSGSTAVVPPAAQARIDDLGTLVVEVNA